VRRPLAVVPDVPPRAIAYVRVSDEGGRGDALLSPEIQVAAIRAHCERSGYELVDVLEDVDLTGRFWRRRQVETAVSAIESGAADVLVVWKVSRVARNRRDWAIAVDRVEGAGGRLESATEPNDQNASGKFARGMLAELAAFESDRIGEGWQEVHARRIAAGRPANGKPRWGYTYDAETKLHVPDTVTGPVLAEVYRRYIAGESVYALTRWLNERGFRTSDGYSSRGPGLWSSRSLRRVLDSGFAAGLLLVGREHRPGVHEPVIDSDTWEAYLVARERRRVHRGSERSQYLLSGLVRCECGSAMTAGQFGDNHVPKYRCKAAVEQGAHRGGYVTAALVEGAVIDWLRDLAVEVDESTAAASAAASARVRQAHDVRRLEREIRALDEQLVDLTRQLVRKLVPEAAYVTLRDELTAQQTHLQQQARELGVQSRREPPRQVARDLLAQWDVLPVEHRRQSLHDLMRHVVVTPGRPRATFRIVEAW